MSQPEPCNIFISYGRGDDIPFVEKLYDSLKANGHKVWFDKKNLESNGLSFLQNIRDSLALNNIRLLLIVGPHASKSDYVRYEWEFALTKCMMVIPLLRVGNEKNADATVRESNTDYDLIPEPIKKRRFHCIDFRRGRPYEQALKELLLNLSTPVPPFGELFSVPNKPANFISRNVDIQKIKEIIMADVFNPGVITSVSKSTAIQGMGGIGKSVLAAAVCQDCDVMRLFSDGIYWITIGQENAEINVINGIQLLTENEYLNLKDNYENVRNKLREAIKDKNCLIVLDDVWDQRDISIFPSDQALRYRLLITTRNKQTVHNLVSKVYEIGLFSVEEARVLLSKSANNTSFSKTVLPKNLPTEADLIIEECGHLPLAIAMAGGMISSGEKERWKDVLEALQEADLSYIEKQFPDYPYSNLFKVLDISVTFLDELLKKKYLQLAIFPKDAIIPKDVIHLLWKKESESERHTNKHLDELIDRSLIQRFGEGLYALHDLQTNYLKITCENLKDLNKLFVTKLGNPLMLSNIYSWSNYIWHLKEAEETDKAINPRLGVVRSFI